MVNPVSYRETLNKFILKNGELSRLQYFTSSFNTGSYDDENAPSQSGADVWVRTIVQPVNVRDSSDRNFLEQGIITHKDQRAWFVGSIDFFPGDVTLTKVGLGSPTTTQYKLLDEGVTEWKISGVPVYKKAFFRELNNGSWLGE